MIWYVEPYTVLQKSICVLICPEKNTQVLVIQHLSQYMLMNTVLYVSFWKKHCTRIAYSIYCSRSLQLALSKKKMIWADLLYPITQKPHLKYVLKLYSSVLLILAVHRIKPRLCPPGVSAQLSGFTHMVLLWSQRFESCQGLKILVLVRV